MNCAPGLAWCDALTALRLVQSGSLSLTVRARSGAVRDALLARLDPGTFLRISAETDAEALSGGIDLLASLSAGHGVYRKSLAERIQGKVLVVAGAERVPAPLAAMLASIMEARKAGVVLLDEGVNDEGLPAILQERAAMLVDLDAVSIREIDMPRPPSEQGQEVDDPALLLCHLATALGIASARPPLHALAVARALADGEVIDEVAIETALRLVLAPRASYVPPADEDPDEPAETDHDDGNGEADGEEMIEPPDKPLEDQLIEAARALLPEGLLEGFDAIPGTGGRQSGSARSRRGTGARGRPGPPRIGLPRRGARLDIAATLIAAAPMQRIRARKPGQPIAVRSGDIRVRRPQPRQPAATIFAVDASGSAAIARLGEAKGAIEKLLAQSYVRRDEAALVAFRGQGAETLLPPTRSLARAKRELAALPGGGPTPLADGIIAALQEALRSRDAGRRPLLVLVTDGGANVARDGSHGRGPAREDAEGAARLVAAAGIAALVVDSSARGNEQLAALAALMGARYFALPRLDGEALSRIAATAR